MKRSDDGIQMLTLCLSDPDLQPVLQEWIESQSDVTVVQQVEQPAPGDQGGIAALIVTGTVSTLITAINVLPEFLRSQRRTTVLRCELSDGSRKRTVEFKTEATPRQTEELLGEVIRELRESLDD